MAPEIFTDFVVSKASDVWAFGILFHEIMTSGELPYKDFSNMVNFR